MVHVDSDGDTLTLTTQVDVSEASDAQQAMFTEMAYLFGERYELFVDKNLSYGNSFITQAASEYLSNPDKYESVTHSVLDNLDTRLGDKDNRAKNLLNGGPELVGEDYSETVGDAAVYRLMQEMISNKGEKVVDKTLPSDIQVGDA